MTRSLRLLVRVAPLLGIALCAGACDDTRPSPLLTDEAPRPARDRAPLAGADRESPTRIADFIGDVEAVHRGDAAMRQVLDKYRNAVVRWVGRVEGHGGNDVRIRVGPIGVEVPRTAPGFASLGSGAVVRVEGRIQSMSLAPWVYLSDVKLLTSERIEDHPELAAPGRR